MFHLNMVDYPVHVFFPLLSTLAWDTQGYLGLLSDPCTPTQTFQKLLGGWVAHEILVTAQRQNCFFHF